MRKWERWEEASAGWAATGSGEVEKGEHMNPRSQGSSASKLQTWRKRTQDHADSEKMDGGVKAPE